MMIAHAAKPDGSPLLLLGLSRGNIDRLVAGMPIRLTRETHGDGIPEGWAILLIFGETEQAIVEDLAQAGVIGPDTEKHIEPRLGL